MKKIFSLCFVVLVGGFNMYAQTYDVIPQSQWEQLTEIRDSIGEISNLDSLYEDRTHPNGLPYHIYIPDSLEHNTDYPLLIFLHGSSDLSLDVHNGFPKGIWSLPMVQNNHPHILFVPRYRDDNDHWINNQYRKMFFEALNDLVTELNNNVNNANIDISRIYLTGFSEGGEGTWNYTRNYPNKFAAAAPLSGFFEGPQDENEALEIKHVPIWIFNGDGDSGVAGSRISYSVLEAVEATDVRYHEYEDHGHVIDDFAYFTEGFIDWFFSNKKTTTAIDKPFSGDFAIKLRAIPSSLPMNGAVGLSKKALVNSWSDYNVSVLFASDSTIKVSNGGSYEALSSIKYEAGKAYTFYIWGNTVSSKFNVKLITIDGQVSDLAENYEFNLSYPGDTLNYIVRRTVQDTVVNGTPGSYIAIDGVENGKIVFEEDFIAIVKDIEEQFGRFSVAFAVTPSSVSIGGGISFNSTESVAWEDLSAIVRFNAAGQIEARNGGAYDAETEVLYEAGHAYNFNVDIDVVANTYTVTVKSDPWAEPDTIGTNYTFRKTPVSSLKYITYKVNSTTGTLTFNQLDLYIHICEAPTIDEVQNFRMFSGEEEKIINISGITYGDEISQNISITATSSHPEIITPSVVLGTDNTDATLTLKVNEVSEETVVTITITVSDECDAIHNGGIVSTVKTFRVVVSASSTVNNEVSNKIKIFPNPVLENITITNASDIRRIEIISILGKKLLESFSSGEETLHLSTHNLHSGLYLIKCIDYEGSVSSKKIVKE